MIAASIKKSTTGQRTCGFGILESTGTEENTRDLIYHFLERELDLNAVRDIQF